MTIKLSNPVTDLPSVGEVYAKRLRHLKIKTIRDLLYHFPFRYQDFSQTKKIRYLAEGDEVTVAGEVIKVEVIRAKGGKLLTKAAVADETGAIEAIWFNQPYLKQALEEGKKIYLAGQVEQFGRHLGFVSPTFEPVDDETGPIHTGGLVPVYPETGRVSSKWLRARIKRALALFNPGELADLEFIPREILQEEGLPDLEEALQTIHFPKSEGEAKKARRRFAFEELLLLNLRSIERRRRWNERKLAARIDIPRYRREIEQFIDGLPFTLTGAQKRAAVEILNDLNKPTPMNRLLEGDVGSGKTVIAAIAAYACFLNGMRTVLMAPTEILAQQHYETLKSLLEPYGITCALHTGGKKPKLPDYPAVQLPDLWIGTHALFYRKGSFKGVGLVVIDEQHRFGVEQRAELVKKAGDVPHILTLTATPIPRSLALTVYGDLDLSIIDELPPGRKRIKTFVVPEGKRQAGYRWIGEKVKSGEQAFIICPLIEESEKVPIGDRESPTEGGKSVRQVKAATAEYEKLQKVFPNLSLGLLHGRLKVAEKNDVIDKFRKGKHQILIATPVVEVGIDIPKATIMVIEAADRFGLASLHQLRGRVGRGDKESYCFLFTENGGRDVFKRLKALESTTSGFELAELDLKLRGPGEIYGTKQHGLLELKVADLSDTKMLKAARESAHKIMDGELPPRLRQELERFTTSLVEPN